MCLSSQLDYTLKSGVMTLTFTLSSLVLAMSPAWHTGDAQLAFTHSDAGVQEAWVVKVVNTSSFSTVFLRIPSAITFHWVLIKGNIKFFTSINTWNMFPQDYC